MVKEIKIWNVITKEGTTVNIYLKNTMDDLKIKHVYYNFHIFLLVDKYFRKKQFKTRFKILTQDMTLLTEKTVGVAFGQRQDFSKKLCHY